MTQIAYWLIPGNPCRQHATSRPVAVLECAAQQLRIGDNGVYLRGGELAPRALWFAGQRISLPEAPPFEFRSFSATQRSASRNFCAWLCQQCAGLAAVLSVPPTLPRLTPSILAVVRNGQLAFHHFVQQGELGSMFVRYGEEPLPLPETVWTLIDAAWPRHADRIDTLRTALGDECWYIKWRPDLEMERKFTFAGIPDTWRLLLALHDAIAAGRLPSFVPELDREIQVWDYEQHIFEVHGGEAESGYIAYIPQADGLMTVKRKWFVANSEIRRESLLAAQALTEQDIEQHVHTLTTAPLRRLPSYRRKRFDAQFESLDTGNIFGIYMDVCRTLDDAAAFSQCEVEYCRTRTFGTLRNLMDDFDTFSDFVGCTLRALDVAFQQDLYSKLDFVRDVAARGADLPDRYRDNAPQAATGSRA